jgi:NAD(P)-dependent dehydrogenase (short-subunit alcohol dehydrogenase family)
MTISEGLALSGKVALITGVATGIGRARCSSPVRARASRSST